MWNKWVVDKSRFIRAHVHTALSLNPSACSIATEKVNFIIPRTLEIIAKASEDRTNDKKGQTLTKFNNQLTGSLST